MISTTLNLNICREKPFKVDFIDILKFKFMPAILFCSITPEGVNDANQSEWLKHHDH